MSRVLAHDAKLPRLRTLFHVVMFLHVVEPHRQRCRSPQTLQRRRREARVPAVRQPGWVIVIVRSRPQSLHHSSHVPIRVQNSLRRHQRFRLGVLDLLLPAVVSRGGVSVSLDARLLVVIALALARIHRGPTGEEFTEHRRYGFHRSRVDRALVARARRPMNPKDDFNEKIPNPNLHPHASSRRASLALARPSRRSRRSTPPSASAKTLAATRSGARASSVVVFRRSTNHRQIPYSTTKTSMKNHLTHAHITHTV